MIRSLFDSSAKTYAETWHAHLLCEVTYPVNVRYGSFSACRNSII